MTRTWCAVLMGVGLSAFALGVRAPRAVPPSPPVEHSGCCSHHNGVCGCDGVHATCCDGTVSKSCGCD